MSTALNSAHNVDQRPTALLLRRELLAQGFTRSAIRHRITTGEWHRMFDGLYVDTTFNFEEQCVARKAAYLQRCGPCSAFSHKTAASFHGFDSTDGWAPRLQITQPFGTEAPRIGGVDVMRSRTLFCEQLVENVGLRYTSRARTVLDIVSRVDLVEGERVLESALRGSDPKRPDVWRSDVLAELEHWIHEHPRQPGVQKLRQLLALRPAGCRPTGSIGETAMVQVLRRMKLTETIRQPRVVAPDEHGNPRDHYLDTLVLPHMLDIEVDGATHAEPRRRAEDIKRDRRLAGGFTVLRFTALQALHQPEYVMQIIQEEIRRREYESTFLRPPYGFSVVGSQHEWRITRTASEDRIAS